MANATNNETITAEDCHFARLSASMLIDELRELLESQTIPQDDPRELRRCYQRIDNLHDAVARLTARFQRDLVA